MTRATDDSSSEESKTVVVHPADALPQTLQRAFSAADAEGRVRCARCAYRCVPSADRILFHLAECGGSLTAQKPALQHYATAVRYKCLPCGFCANRLAEWTRHLYAVDHIATATGGPAAGHSYDCDRCGTHYYGPEDAVLRHRPCRPPVLASLLSELMARVYSEEEHGAMMRRRRHHYYYYCCTDCEHYSRDADTVHATVEKRCGETFGGREPAVCRACRVTFLGSRGRAAHDRHLAYFEHAMLWCVDGDRTASEQQLRLQPMLPGRVARNFVASELLGRIRCVACHRVEPLSADAAYRHYVSCVASKRVSDDVDRGCTPLRGFDCRLCDCYDVDGDDTYRRWIEHVIGVEHVKRTFVDGDRHYLYSYYCHVSETITFATASSVQSALWRTNDDTDRMLFVSEAMADVYRRANAFPDCAPLHCCGVCLRYTDREYCEHERDPSYYCEACAVGFNVRADYAQHLLSSEHVVLNYLAPPPPEKTIARGEAGETSGEENSTTAVVASSSEIKPEDYVVSLIDRLNERPTGLASVLRMKMELLMLGAAGYETFFESDCYFCGICDLVCMDELIWKSHDREYHADVASLSVFYCAVCRAYCVDAAMEIDSHVDSREHGVMLDRQEYAKSNKGAMVGGSTADGGKRDRGQIPVYNRSA